MIKLKLALRYLVRKPVTLFAVASVLLGTTAFIVVMGVMDGYVTAFNERSRTILSDMIVRTVSGNFIGDPDEISREIKDKVDDVVECSPVITGLAVLKVKSRADTGRSFTLRWCRFWGVDPVREHAVTGIDQLATVPAGTHDWIIPGGDLLGNTHGDETPKLTLVTSSRTGSGPPLRAEVKIASVVNLGLRRFDREFAYISRDLAAKFVGLKDPSAASILRVRVRDPRRAGAIRREIQDLLDGITGERRFEVKRYQETSTMFRALNLQRELARFILGCLFVAAGFAVVAICYMIVLQKIRDIGVLRTIGLSRGGVMSTFVIYGVVIGLAGVVLGILLGVFILDHIETVRQALTNVFGHDPFPQKLYGFEKVPTEVNLGMLLWIAIIAVAVSFLGSLYPAWKAARLNVVESLRYE